MSLSAHILVIGCGVFALLYGFVTSRQVLAADAGNAGFFIPAARAGHALFDLPGFIAERLRRLGIAEIEDTGRCTYAEPAEFFSYRASTHRGESDYGRHVNAIALAG